VLFHGPEAMDHGLFNEANCKGNARSPATQTGFKILLLCRRDIRQIERRVRSLTLDGCVGGVVALFNKVALLFPRSAGVDRAATRGPRRASEYSSS